MRLAAGWKVPRGCTIKSFMTLSPPHTRPIHPWHFTPAFGSWVGMYSKRVQTDGRGSAFIQLLGQRFALLHQTWGRKHVTLVAAADPLAAQRGACLTTKLKIRKRTVTTEWEEHCLGPGLHSAQSSLPLDFSLYEQIHFHIVQVHVGWPSCYSLLKAS